MIEQKSTTVPPEHQARPATAAELISVLGELEPLTIEQLLVTGATVDEVAAAAAALEDADGFGESRHEPASAREAEVRAILEALALEDAEEREAEGDIARS